MNTEERLLGGFSDRKRRYQIYVTETRIFGVDIGKPILTAFLMLAGASIAYIIVFASLLPLLVDATIFLPLVVLVGIFPFLYFIARWTRHRLRLNRGSENRQHKFEIMKGQIAQIAIQKPSLASGFGRLVISLKSAGFMEFRLVGGRQFQQVRTLMEQFCSGTGIQLVESK